MFSLPLFGGGPPPNSSTVLVTSTPVPALMRSFMGQTRGNRGQRMANRYNGCSEPLPIAFSTFRSGLVNELSLPALMFLHPLYRFAIRWPCLYRALPGET